MNPTRLKHLLDYNRDTGQFTWREHRGNVKAGQIAGSTDAKGYRVIRLEKNNYLAHRLAWLFVYGELPTEHIDHKNGLPSDNKIENLRLATRSENMRNRKLHSNNSSGFKGVGWNKNANKWQAYIRLHGKRHHLGLFETPESAYLAYCEAANIMHGAFCRL